MKWTSSLSLIQKNDDPYFRDPNFGAFAYLQARPISKGLHQKSSIGAKGSSFFMAIPNSSKEVGQFSKFGLPADYKPCHHHSMHEGKEEGPFRRRSIQGNIGKGHERYQPQTNNFPH